MQFKVITDKEYAAHSRFVMPPEKARAGWRFDHKACLEAMDLLELELPVRMRYIRGRRRLGTHYAQNDHHKITLSQDRRIEVANETLWHELMHAKQSEDWCRRTGKKPTEFYREAYMPAKGEWGQSYEGNAYEIECNKFAEKMKGVMLLVRN